MLSESTETNFLIDGFPRNKDNLDGWNEKLSKKVKVHFVLYLNAPLNVCVNRCLQRKEGRTDDNEVINIF